MGSSDLDAHSFVPSGHKVISIKAHCLEGLNDRLLGRRAFQLVSSLGLVVDAPCCPFFLCEVFLDEGGVFTPLNGADLPFDVLNEQLVPVPLGHRKHTLEAFQFRLLLVIHAMERQ